MKPEFPWHVKGVRQKARKTAQEAARRSGMSVGEWLDTVITDSAADVGTKTARRVPNDNAARRPPAKPEPRKPEFDEHAQRRKNGDDQHQGGLPPDLLAKVSNRLDKLTQQLDLRERRTAEAEIAAVNSRLETLTRKLDQHQNQGPDEGLAAVKERLDTLAQQFDRRRSLAPDDDLTDVWAGFDTLAGPPEPRERQVADDNLAAVKERLDTLANQLDRRQNRFPDENLAVVRDRLDTLTRQLEQVSRLPQQDLAAVNGRLDTLALAVDQLVRVHGADRQAPERADETSRELADPASPLDQAMSEIAERQRALDAGPGRLSQNLSGLEDQLRQINAQIETMRPCSLDSAIETLRDDLAEIGLMLKEAMPRKAIEALETEVRSLAERIGESRHAGVEGADIAGLERGLAEVRDALRALTPAENLVGLEDSVKVLSKKIDVLGGSQQDPATLDQLEAAIGTLRGIVSHVASNDALAKLSEEVRALATRVDQIGGLDILSNLEQRIATIADVLESQHQSSHDAHDLATVVEALTDKLERLQLSRSDQAAVSHLEDRIAKLVEKLDASDARLVHLEAIERGLAELLIHIEHQRLPSVARTGAGTAESPEVDTLKRDVKRTQDTVEAVHGTLGQLVDRLAVIETGLRDQSRPDEALIIAPPIAPSEPTAPSAPSIMPPRPAVPPRPAAPSRPTQQAEATAAPPVHGAANVAAPGNSAPATEQRPIDPNLPPDHPLEPGLRVARARGNSPADRIAASEAALASTKPLAIPDPGGKSNFIAAARRAAKAAMAEAPLRGDKPTIAADGAASGAPAAGRLAGLLAGKRARSLLVATSVLLIVLGSLHFAANFFNSSEDGGGTESPPMSHSELPPPPTEPPPGRQSGIPPSGGLGNFGIPGAGLIVPPALPPSPAAPDGVLTGSVRVLDPPAELPSAAARPAAADKLPGGIGGANLRAAAANGDAAAQYEIAARFADGRGVPQDLTAAAEWFERAGNGGLIPAQFRLGGLYEKGLGVKKDLERARRLYAAAAEVGHAKAMHNLAVLYAEGIDGKPDYQSAAKWFRKAAEHGVSDSQYNLGVLYTRGIGIEANLTEAYKWFTLAARDGDKDAAAKRDEVGSRIDPQALMALRAAAQVWTPAQQPDAAVQVKAPVGGWDTAAAPAPAIRRVGGPRVEAGQRLAQ